MRQALTIFSIFLAFSTLSNASRLVLAKRSRLGPREDCLNTFTLETINGEQYCVAPCEDGDTAQIANGVQECVIPSLSKTPAQQSAAAAIVAADKAQTSAADAREVHQNGQGISAGTVILANPDPCGPPTGQAAGAAGSLSTCHANISVANLGQPSSYGVQCANDNSGYALEQSTCSDSSITICDQTSGQWGVQYQQTNTWIWSTQNGNCTFGLPKGGAPPPSFDRCQEQITSVINPYCIGPAFNAGGVNLRILPSAGASNASSTGLPVDPMYPSYVLMPFKSRCGANSTDECRVGGVV